MALAAVGGGILASLGPIREAFRKAKASFRAQRDDDGDEEWVDLRTLRGYRPDVLSEQDKEFKPAATLTGAAWMAVTTWAFLEVDPDLGEIMLAGLLAAAALWSIITSLGKADEELGLDPAAQDPMRGPPDFLDRHGKQIDDLTAAVGMLGMAALFSRRWIEDSWPAYRIGTGFAVLMLGMLALVMIKAHRDGLSWDKGEEGVEGANARFVWAALAATGIVIAWLVATLT